MLSDRLKAGPGRDTEAEAGKAAAAPHAVRRTGRNARRGGGRTDGRTRATMDRSIRGQISQYPAKKTVSGFGGVG